MRYNDSKISKKEVPEMKGFSICGMVLGITATVCGVCSVVFSFLGLVRKK